MRDLTKSYSPHSHSQTSDEGSPQVLGDGSTYNRAQQVRIQLPLVSIGTQTEQADVLVQGLSYPLGNTTCQEDLIGANRMQRAAGGSPQHLVSQDHGRMEEMETEKILCQYENSNKSFQDSPCYSDSKSRTKMSGLSAYLVALRPWSFPASITPVALGSCLAYKSQGTFDLTIFFTTVFTALCVHAAGNLVNTYFDFVRGIDTKKSDDRTLVDSILQPNDVVTLGAIVYVAGCLGFTAVNFLSPAKMEHLALIYFCGLSSSFLYTGGLGLKYIAMGDILIVLTFGPLTVVFSHLSQTGQLSLVPMLYAIPLALNTEAILHSNNTRDMDGDRQAGAITLAVILGKSGSYCLFCFLLFVPYLLYITVGIHYSFWVLLPASSIVFAFRLEKDFRRGQLVSVPQKVAQLNLVMGVLYILSLYLADSESLPSMTPLH